MKFIKSYIESRINTHLTSLKGGMCSCAKGNDFSGNYPIEGITGVPLESEDVSVLVFDDLDIVNNIK